MNAGIGRSGPALAILLLVLCGATPASSQRRVARNAPAMSAGVALGAAGVEFGRRGSSWDIGPLVGGRWRWAGARSGVQIAFDLQPFPASGGRTADAYRALWLLPAWEIRAGSAGLRAGLGLGILRFDRAQFDGRTELTTVTGAGASARLPASLSLELAWRRTGFVRGFRSNIWSLQLVRLWPL